MTAVRQAALVLADGSVFEGEAIGAVVPSGVSSGEVVFNTAMTGYQEILTDPSYAGQIITFTASHVGNYGVNEYDFESRGLFCRGVIVRDLSRRRSNHRSEADLGATLTRYGIAGIAGIDTRRLTRLLRDTGALPGAFGTADEATLLAAATAEPGTDGIDLVAQVSTPHSYSLGDRSSDRLHLVAYDFGIKRSILRQLADLGSVDVVPASTSAADVLARKPDGVFLSNGPGDPETVVGAVGAIQDLIDQVPIFGICLGHQLLSLALGGSTFKLPFGHHGGNHPVRNLATGHVEITSQNHNFCVDPDSLSGTAEVTHINLNDQTNEGMRVPGVAAFSVQYHPEAGPGPHDARYLFAQFKAMASDPAGYVGGKSIAVTMGTSMSGYTPVEVAGMPASERGLVGAVAGGGRSGWSVVGAGRAGYFEDVSQDGVEVKDVGGSPVGHADEVGRPSGAERENI